MGTLETVNAGASGQDLGTAVRELQGLRVDVLAGAAAETNIALAAIETRDVIVSAVLHRAGANPQAVKLTPSANGAGGGIPVNGSVRFVEASNADANDRIVLTWFKKPAATA